MKRTGQPNLLRGQTAVCTIVGVALLWLSQPARAYNYEGAFYVDSASAVTTLQNAGFNVFMVPGGLSHATIQSTLGAMSSPGAIIMLNGFTDTDAQNFVNWLVTIPEYSKVIAYNTFSEPNWDLAGLVPLSRQRSWYTALKQIDSSKTVLVDYHVTACGLPHKELVDANPGLSWDVVMVFMYPYWWQISDSQAITNLQAGANDVIHYFAAGTFIIPLQQAAGYSSDPHPGPVTPVCGEAVGLRAPNGAMDQYNVWYNAGCLNVSHALFYYGWQSSENLNLQTPGWLSAATTQINYHKSLFP